jgi:hypothetical protein
MARARIHKLNLLTARALPTHQRKEVSTMARYFFQVSYHGAMITDDVGEEFATVRQT